MSEDEICTFDQSFIDENYLSLSGRNSTIVTYKAPAAVDNNNNKTSSSRFCTIPLEVPQKYAAQNDGKIHEWTFRIHSLGQQQQEEDGGELIIGLLPCAVWNAPPSENPSSQNNNNTNETSFSRNRIREQFSPSGQNFYLTQPNVNMSKILLRYFDVADLICQFTRQKLFKMISTVFNHSDKTVEKWREFLFETSVNEDGITTEGLVEFKKITSSDELNNNTEKFAKFINYEIELKSRLHELFNFDAQELVRFFLSAGFSGDAEFRAFMLSYLHKTEELFNSNASTVTSVASSLLLTSLIRSHRFASKNHPQQLRNATALESWANSFQLGKTAHELSGVVTENETNNKSNNSEPVWSTEDVQTITEAVFDLHQGTPLDFGVGLTKDGLLRGSLKIVSPQARRVSFSTGDTIFLTLDHKSGRMSIRVGTRLVVADIELSFLLNEDNSNNNNNNNNNNRTINSDLPPATQPTLSPAISLCQTGQSVEILGHDIIPRNAVHRIPWISNEGSVLEDASEHRPGSSYLNSANVHPDSVFGERCGGEAPWRVRPLSTSELCIGNIDEKLANRPRSKISSLDVAPNVRRESLITASNLFEVMLDSKMNSNPYSFTSPLNQHQRCTNNNGDNNSNNTSRYSNLLHQSAAIKAVDMITQACKERNQKKQQQEAEQQQLMIEDSNNNNNQNSRALTTTTSPIKKSKAALRMQITSCSVSRPDEIDSETKFIDVHFPPTRRSINTHVVSKDIDHVHGAPIRSDNGGEGKIVSWSRISEFAKAESAVEEISSCSPMKKLPIIEYPTLVEEPAQKKSSSSSSNNNNNNDEHDHHQFNNTNPRDVIRTSTDDADADLLNSTVVAEVASASIIPNFHKKCFYPSEYNPAGIYCVSLFDPISCQWFGVIIDDFLPMSDKFDEAENIRRPRFVYSAKRNEYWPSLLYKAFCKFYGSYQSTFDGNIPFFASPALLLRGGSTRRFTPSSTDDYFRALSFYADRNDAAVFACSSARDALTGSDQAVGELDGTFTGSSYLVLRTVPVTLNNNDNNNSSSASSCMKMVELLSASTSQAWFGSWAPGSKSWQQYPEVAIACDAQEEERGAKVPTEALRKLRNTCSFWVSVDEMAVFFKSLKCVSSFGDHFDPFDSNTLLIESGETEVEHVESIFREIPRGPANNEALIQSIIGNHPFGRVPPLPDSLTVSCQRVHFQYLSNRESEREEEIPFILGLTGGFFPATSPQYMLKVTEPNTTISLLCDFVFQDFGANCWRKADGSQNAPSPLVSLYHFPDDKTSYVATTTLMNQKDLSNTANRRFTISARNKRIIFPEPFLPQTVVKNTLSSSTSQESPKPILSWRSGGWCEPVTLKKCGQYLIVVSLPRDGGSSAISLSLLGSSRLPPIEALPAVPYRSTIGTIVNSEMVSKVTSSGTGDDRIVVEVDAEEFAGGNKNLRLKMSVRMNEKNGAQQVVVLGEECFTTRLSAVCSLPSEKEVFVVVELVDVKNGSFAQKAEASLVPQKQSGIKAEVRVTSVLGKRHIIGTEEM